MQKQRKLLLIDISLLVISALMLFISFSYEIYTSLITLKVLSIIFLIIFILLNMKICISKIKENTKSKKIFILFFCIEILLIILFLLFFKIKYIFLFDADSVKFKEVSVDNSTTLVFKENQTLSGINGNIYIKINDVFLKKTDCNYIISKNDSLIQNNNFEISNNDCELEIIYKTNDDYEILGNIKI